jgi:hypothetical protein
MANEGGLRGRSLTARQRFKYRNLERAWRVLLLHRHFIVRDQDVVSACEALSSWVLPRSACSRGADQLSRELDHRARAQRAIAQTLWASGIRRIKKLLVTVKSQ